MSRSQLPVFKLQTAHQIAFSPTEDFIAHFGGRDVSALSLATSKELFRVHPLANPSDIDFAADGRRLVVKSTSGRTVILDALRGRVLKDFRNQKEGEGSAALFSSCGKYVVSVSWDGLLSVRDSATGELAFSHVYEDRMLNHLSAPKDRSCFAFSSAIVSPSDSEPPPSDAVLIHPWPIRGGKARELARRWPSIWALQVSPSGRFLAVVFGAPPETLQIYDLKTSRVLARRVIAFGGTGCSIGWSPDESLLATNGDERCLVLEMPKLRVRHEFSLPDACFVGFSPSGRYFAAGSWTTSFVVPLEHLAQFAESRPIED
jgi:WD40 repeat protein